MRVGLGEDIHRVDGMRTLVLGGVLIEEGPGLAGVSDADVLLHAITDAVLGAAALGDIGTHFSPDDPQWKDADSADLLRRSLAMVRDQGWDIANIDATVRTERPKLAPYMPHIRARVAEISGLGAGQVSIKAKTSEGLDAVGRGEAMSATAVVLLTSGDG